MTEKRTVLNYFFNQNSLQPHLGEALRNTGSIIQDLPSEVSLVAAAKTRCAEEAAAAVQAGVRILGHNYVQEAEKMIQDWVVSFGCPGLDSQLPGMRPLENPISLQWHLIGHLQRNKAKKAVQLFDMIQTLDSPALAEEIHRQCLKIGKTMDVLVEVNSGSETSKNGVEPERVTEFIREISTLEGIRVRGLMTMGPAGLEGTELRPYFRLTSELFRELKKLDIPGVEMLHLSMGMSDSYQCAIQEGATMVRIGTALFGQRPARNN